MEIQHRHYQDMIPRSIRDRFTLALFILGGPLTIWFEFFIVMPNYNYDINLLWAHKLYCTVVAIQVYWNLYYMLRTDTSVKILNTQGQGDTHPTCKKCNLAHPSRSHHCKICDICILKRDHHCWFAGYCIGFYNHRYYLMVIIYSWLAGLYASIYQFPYIVSVLGLSFRSLVSIVAPHFLWVLGYYTNYEFFIAAMFDISLYCMALLTWLLVNQIQQILKGQTSYERSKDLNIYGRKSVHENVCEVLGECWFLVMLAPWFESELPSIQKHWTVLKED